MTLGILGFFQKTNKQFFFLPDSTKNEVVRSFFWKNPRIPKSPFEIIWPLKQLFWEGHKNLLRPPHGFDIYLVNVKIIRRMAQIFVAFSEKLNFK